MVNQFQLTAFTAQVEDEKQLNTKRNFIVLIKALNLL